MLQSVYGDTNADLVKLGPAVLRRRLAGQLAPADVRRFLVEPDPRPLPEADRVTGELDAMIDSLATMFADTRLEDDLDDLLWALFNIFHRRIDRLERDLDANVQAQRRSQAEQDGSEVRSVELERLIVQGQSLIERRNAFEFCRDNVASRFEAETGSAWRPRSGSRISHRNLTSAMIDSREFIEAKRRAEQELLIPKGPRIAFTGGAECNDHQRIWAVLDKVRAKHQDMVLLHAGSPKGAERIAACWAEHRKVPQVVFKPDWNRHKNAAPSSATISCSRRGPSASSPSPAPASLQTLPIRPKKWAFRCGGLPTRAARKRRCFLSTISPPTTSRFPTTSPLCLL